MICVLFCLPLLWYAENVRQREIQHWIDYALSKMTPAPNCSPTTPTPPLINKEGSPTTPPPFGSWNFDAPFSVPSEQCVNVQVIPPLWKGITLAGFTQCVRRTRDVVSDYIKTNKRWHGCEGPLSLYTGGGGGLVLDVGANMGSCSFLFLAAGARVIAFEPLPANLYYFHESITKLNSQWKANLTLWPVALGERRKKETIYTETGNAGNSVLGFPTRAQRSNAQVVQVVPLDELLWPDPTKPVPRIEVMKMDIQGYELHALAGAKRLLAARAIKVIQTEVSTEWLTNLGRKPSDVCRFLMDEGFELFEDHCVGTLTGKSVRGRPLVLSKCEQWDKQNAECDIVAKLK